MSGEDLQRIREQLNRIPPETVPSDGFHPSAFWAEIAPDGHLIDPRVQVVECDGQPCISINVDDFNDDGEAFAVATAAAMKAFPLDGED